MSFTSSHFYCPVCGLAEKEIEFYGFSYCNHPICGVCAIKLQKFSKETGNDYDYSKCVICKQDISKIILTSHIQPFENFDRNNLLSDTKYELLFESAEAELFYKNVIKIFCPKCKIAIPSNTVKDLLIHIDEHRVRYCELCTEFKKCLYYELEVYTDNEYHKHRCKMHPKCQFCEIRFYDDSHLLKHVKEKHFICDICQRNKGCVAYNTQNELLNHFLKDHFVCNICRNNNCINVFESEYNLKTHRVSAHSQSLVGEGLVNVGFGNRDNLRYGNRRRAREEDGGLNENSAMDVPVPQQQEVPTMNCEQEFPRLGADSIGSVQLGVQSLSLDINDTRTAFVDQTDMQTVDKVTKKPSAAELAASSQVYLMSKQEKMSDNFAISVKRSAGGSLNAADFPSLSSSLGTGPTGQQQNLANGKSTVKKASQKVKASQHISPRTAALHDDFPSLPVAVGKLDKSIQSNGNTEKNAAWKAMRPATNYTSAQNCQVRNTELQIDCQDDFVKVTVAEERPKVLLSEHEFQQVAGGRQTVKLQQTVPDAELDFPSLCSHSDVSSSKSSTGWGKSVSSVSHNSATVTKKQYDKFVINSKLDFPGLPVSQSRSQFNHHHSNKTSAKSGFASAAASSRPNTAGSGKIHVKPAQIITTTPISKVDVNSNTFEHPQPKTPTSLRGIDYIPSVAPTKDPLILVDSKQFSIMKQAKEHHTSCASAAEGGQLTIQVASNEDEFPVMQNRYSGLPTDNLSPVPADNNKSKSSAAKSAPRIESESDFPTLAPSRPTNRSMATETQLKKKHKPTENSRSTSNVKKGTRDPQPPVVSLMDVAMSVAQKIYTPLSDADLRNQKMFMLVTDSLDADTATQFLQLANQYRTRKLSVHDYLDSLQSDLFRENIDFVSRMLPEMCVLLPDIPLQVSLMSNMPRAWIKDLRQCTKCHQVLHKTDLALHNQSAH